MRDRKIQKVILWQIFFLVCTFSVGIAQNNSTDTSFIAPSTQINDSDSAKTDTMVRKLRTSPNAVTSVVDYFAKDSVSFNLDSSLSSLYNAVELNYEEVNLQSNYVEINFSKKELFASGDSDTNGTLRGTPVFKQESYEFKCHELLYNFDTKKGLIRNVITQEGESYLHGELVKKNEDNSSYIYKGKYTTCNLEHPHYEISFKKAKVIPNDIIVTGPFFIKIDGVPVNPVPVPFGIFPNSNKRKNGLLLPKFGRDVKFGSSLDGIGYYFTIKDIMDYSITADIYMRGKFAVGVLSNYVKRYKMNGRYDIKYSFTPEGERTIDTGKYAYNINHDIQVKWTHQQDRRAHPANNFSANVDFQTSSYSKNNLNQSIADKTKSKAVSTVSFSTIFKGKYSFGTNIALSQDFANNDLVMTLPQINFNISQFYPFRRKQVVGKTRWYENISMQYTMDFQNVINTKDTILIKHFKDAFDKTRTGMSHHIPIKSTIKILKYINWENSATLLETWQIKGVIQSWGDYDTIIKSNIHKKDTIGFFPAHNLDLSSGLSTTLYGMYSMKKGRVSAIRHTLTPSVSFSYKPAINKGIHSKYEEELKKTIYDTINKTSYDSIYYRETRYSYLDGSLYSVPAYKSSGTINFSIGNRLEMKVRSKKDGDEAFKKVTILENVSISTYYDLLADSLNWGKLNVSGRTVLFKQINVNFTLSFDPYIIDTNGVRINKTELKEHHRLYRLSEAGTGVSFSYDINENMFNKKKAEKKEKKASPSGFGEWNVNVAYNFSYGLNDNRDFYLYAHRVDTAIPKYNNRFNNSLTFRGNIVLTPKWNFTFESGYNFTEKSITSTEFRIERDLHCWVIHFLWSPFPVSYRRFEFGINAKASILRDAQIPPQNRYYYD